MSACARALAWRSCSAITLSRCLLPVLREQDQRSGVRRLQAEHQRQEDERVVVPAQVARAPAMFQQHPDDDEQRHADQEPRGAHEPRELLGEDAERVRVVRSAAAPAAPACPAGCRGAGAGLAHRRHPRRSSRDDGLVAPVLGQHVVEQVVDGDRAEQAAVLVDDRRGDQVVRRQVGGHLVDASPRGAAGPSSRRARRPPGSTAARAAAAGCGRRRAAGRSASPAAGGRRRPARPAPG